MKKVGFAVVLSLLLLCCAAAASAGVYGHYRNDDVNTDILILKKPVSDTLGGIYLCHNNYKLSLDWEEKKDDSLRVYTPLSESSAIVDLLLTYEDDSKQSVLVTGSIARFKDDGSLIEDPGVKDMQAVRFLRQEVPPVSELKGTRWIRYMMTVSSGGRSCPFDGYVIEFFDTEENAGQIPDNAVRTYPFTYTVDGGQLILEVEAGGETTEATVKIDSDILIVTIQNSTLYYLPSTL